MGTKRSIEEEVRRRGHEVLYIEKSYAPHIARIVQDLQPDQVWLAHSDLRGPPKGVLKVPVIGFGFSDPYYFSEDRFASYDGYVTNHFETLQKYGQLMPMHYNPTACDLRFHQKNEQIGRDIDLSIIGVAEHPRFHNRRVRIEYADRLRQELPERTINCYGYGWASHPRNSPPIEGDEFLNVIWGSRIGLDIQDDWSPLAHRMFEYIASGTPVITRERAEVEMVFKQGEEILTYNGIEDLLEKVKFYLESGAEELQQIANRGYDRCVADHDIRKRVTGILEFAETSF